MKYLTLDRCLDRGTPCKEIKKVEGQTGNNANTNQSTEVVEPSSWLRLHKIQEENMKLLHLKLQKVLVKVKAVEDTTTDRETRAKHWARERQLSREVVLVGQGLEVIVKMREERERLELIWAVDRELGDFC